jgi:hypothetical protein
MNAHQVRDGDERTLSNISLVMQLVPDLMPSCFGIIAGLQAAKERAEIDRCAVARH